MAKQFPVSNHQVPGRPRPVSPAAGHRLPCKAAFASPAGAIPNPKKTSQSDEVKVIITKYPQQKKHKSSKKNNTVERDHTGNGPCFVGVFLGCSGVKLVSFGSLVCDTFSSTCGGDFYPDIPFEILGCREYYQMFEVVFRGKDFRICA